MKGRKTGGRKKGTPNKVTGEIRDILREVLTSEAQAIPALLSQIEEPAKRLELLAKFLPYVAPRLQSVEVEKPKGNQQGFSGVLFFPEDATEEEMSRWAEANSGPDKTIIMLPKEQGYDERDIVVVD